MLKRLSAIWLAVAVLVTAAGTASGGQFILRAKSAADAQTLCNRYGLVDTQLVHQEPDGTDEICVVMANTQSAAEDEALKTLVTADPLTVSFEIDTNLTLAEESLASGTSTSASGAGLAQSTAAILESFASQLSIPYYGGQVPQAFVSQPAAGLIRLSRAQRVATGGGIVAVIDTGVDPGHPALTGVLVSGYDFVNHLGGIPTDFGEIEQSTAAILEQLSAAAPDGIAFVNQSTAAILEQSTAAILESAQIPAAFGHGTMVAGLVHLVAPTAAIMPLKAFRADGSAALSDLVSAIYYAVDNGATVINMSFTLTAPSRALWDAIAYAAGRQVVLVAAVGNDGSEMTTYPASWPGVIAVAATTMADRRAEFSNYGSRVDLSAPGEALITPYPGNHYAAAWGTSFATALVSGAASLVQQFRPSISADGMLKALEHGEEISSLLGKARLDLWDALYHLLYD
jgi:subtilisin family serine protease